MSYIVGQSDLGRGQESGRFVVATEDWARSRRLYLPPNTHGLRRTPYGGTLGRRHYVVGMTTANVLIDEEYRCLKQSIPAPNAAPTVVAGGTAAFNQIGYTRFFDEVTQERGPLSEGREFVGDASRAWTNLPTTVPGEDILLDPSASSTVAAGVITNPPRGWDILRPGDRLAISTDLTRWARVRSATISSIIIDDTGMAGVNVSLVCKPISRCSHVETWVSVDGGLPRFGIRVRLGVTSVSESIATLALGEAETESFGAMPQGYLNALYNQRQLIAGVDGSRDTVYLSIIGFPERYGGLKLVTPFNEPIVGMRRYRKFVVVICPDSSYVVQGITDDDYTMEPLEPGIGGLGPSIDAEGVLYIPSSKGMQAYDGAFHRIIPTRRSEWSRAMLVNRIAYETGFMAINADDSTVQFYPRNDSVVLDTGLDSSSLNNGNTAPVWIGQYEGYGPTSDGGVQAPEWTDDTNTGLDESAITAAAYLRPPNATVGQFYRGSEDGHIYVEGDIETVALHVDASYTLRHDMFGEYGGKRDEAKKLERLYSYLRSEYSNFTVMVYPGDEFAVPRDRSLSVGAGISIHDPAWQATVIATFLRDNPDLTGEPQPDVLSPVVTHPHPEVNKDGRGFSIRYVLKTPRGAWFIGVGGWIAHPGIATRPYVTDVFLVG